MDTHQFELPAVEIARERMVAVMRRKAQVTIAILLTVSLGILAVAWKYGELSTWQVVLLLAAGGAISGAINAANNYSRLMRNASFFLESLHADSRAGLLAEMHNAKQRVISATFGAVVLATALVAWTGMGQGRVWIVLACLAALMVFPLSMRLSGASAPEFVELARAANKTGFRIAVFRPFGPIRSSLARNALVPILAGYGAVDIVMDPTLEEASATGVLGGTFDELGDLAEVHRYSNEDWKEGVEAVIRQADIAIIDITIARPGVTWEMAKCYEHLPPHRVYCAVDASIVEKEGSLIDHVGRLYDQIEAQADTNFPRNVRPYVFVFWPITGHQLVIAQDVHRKLCELIAIDIGMLERPIYDSDTPDDAPIEHEPDLSHPALALHPERVAEAIDSLQPGAKSFLEQSTHFSVNLGCGGILILGIVLIVLVLLF